MADLTDAQVEKIMDIKELYWAAGFIEGEGCFGGRVGRGSVRVSVGQVQRAPLERLQIILGGHVWGPKFSKQPNRQPAWVWQISGPAAVGVMMTLYALMSPRRKEQIRATLYWWHSRAVYARFRIVCPQGHPLDGKMKPRENRQYSHRYCRTCNRERRRLPASDPRARLERRVG